MPNLSQAMRIVEVDGRVYFDLEQLLEMMYEVVNNSSIVATEAKDPALGIMTAGMQTLCQALDAVLTAQKVALGLDDPVARCRLSKSHAEHKWMFARKAYKCLGVV